MKTAIEEIYSTKDFTSGLKDIDGKKGIVTGYFADFNSTDSDGDIIMPGAFDKTIKATGPGSPKPRIKHLMNHNIAQPLGVIQSLREDVKGLYYESKIGSHSLGTDFIKMAESGLITEHSIGYRTMKSNQIKEGEGARQLLEVKLYEGSSLTAWGANENTPLTGIKGLNQTELNKIINRAEAIEKFARDSDATDETIEMLLLYSKQLLQVISDSVLSPERNEDLKESDSTHSVLAIVPEDSIKPFVAVTCQCPTCKKQNYTTEKGYVKCRGCNKVYVPGAGVTLIL